MRIISLVVVLTIFILSGCSNPQQPVLPSPLVMSVRNPVRVAILPDGTGSWQTARTERLKVEDLDPLFSLCTAVGCEIDIDLITQSSDRGMIRLLVLPPPAVPIPPNEKMNPFDRAEKLAEYNKLMELHKTVKNKWEEQTKNEIIKFKDAIQPLLQHPANARRTNVYDAIRRADTAIGEPDDIFGEPTHRYILVISDAVHNTTSEKPTLSSDATLILVNGVGENSLKDLSPMRFESAKTAILWVIAKERKADIKDDLSASAERRKEYGEQ